MDLSSLRPVRSAVKSFLARWGLLESCLILFDAWNSFCTEVALDRRHRRACKLAGRIVLDESPIRLELGGGDSNRDGWLNADLFGAGSSLTLDLRRRLPFPAESIDEIYAEHVFEHFNYPYPLRNLMRECFRVLKVGAALKLAVPDCGKALRLYSLAEDKFYSGKFWSSPNPDWTTGAMDELNWLYYMDGQHKFMFDDQNLVNHLAEAGFGQVSRRDFEPLLDNAERRQQSLYVVAVKTTSTPCYLAVAANLERNRASDYDALWESETITQVYATPARRALWRNLAARIDGVGGRILDVGCGGGHLLSVISSEGSRSPNNVFGVDCSINAVRQSRERNPGTHVTLCDASQLHFVNDCFEAVVSSETLEHVDDPPGVLREIHRVLRPAGRLVVSIPNGVSDRWAGHKNFWSADAFISLCLTCGYVGVTSEELENGMTLLFTAEKSVSRVCL